MNVPFCLCKHSGLLRNGAPEIIYYCYQYLFIYNLGEDIVVVDCCTMSSRNVRGGTGEEKIDEEKR